MSIVYAQRHRSRVHFRFLPLFIEVFAFLSPSIDASSLGVSAMEWISHSHLRIPTPSIRSLAPIIRTIWKHTYRVENWLGWRVQSKLEIFEFPFFIAHSISVLFAFLWAAQTNPISGTRSTKQNKNEMWRYLAWKKGDFVDPKYGIRSNWVEIRRTFGAKKTNEGKIYRQVRPFFASKFTPFTNFFQFFTSDEKKIK